MVLHDAKFSQNFDSQLSKKSGGPKPFSPEKTTYDSNLLYTPAFRGTGQLTPYDMSALASSRGINSKRTSLKNNVQVLSENIGGQIQFNESNKQNNIDATNAPVCSPVEYQLQIEQFDIVSQWQ